jgi:hypothetical protein
MTATTSALLRAAAGLALAGLAAACSSPGGPTGNAATLWLNLVPPESARTMALSDQLPGPF